MMFNSRQNSILIVDDIPTNIKVLVDYLNHAGFKISVAKSGESALEKVQEVLPDLILLDVMMPGIDGFETCARLKRNVKTQEIPIIFMTALTDVVDKVRGLQLGAVDYITKPVQLEEVLARIHVHLALRNTQIDLTQEVTECKQAEATLQQALQDLKQTQTQLIQSEKMSSLGQLVAGIAHEINNPINFIHGNIGHASQCTQDLLGLVQLYQQYYPEPAEEIQDEIANIDLNFLSTDLIKLFQSMQIGTERICGIVKSLRTFSRFDEAAVKAVDLHAGIDSSLMILHHRLKARPEYPAIDVIKNYGPLPEVECHAGQINQVFMNILSNAIDALESAREVREAKNGPGLVPCIHIHTEVLPDQWVGIYIADNGIGIPPEVEAKLFDPFFTTKPVGKGTGLGLAISYQIITDKHGGTITCHSTPGQGTEFAIKIPIQPAALPTQSSDSSEALVH